MKIQDRIIYLNRQMEQSYETGASQAEIAAYESSLAEMIKISGWLREQCSIHNKILSEQTSAGRKSYLRFQNNTGIDFKFIAMEVKIIRREEEVDSFEVATSNWKDGDFAKLYFDETLKENDGLSFDPNNIEYQVDHRR